MLIRYLLPAFFSIALPLLLCGKAPDRVSKPIVAVSIPPQRYFVEKIAGDLVDVLVMVPPGSSPHTYEPKPAQMAALSKAALYFTIGIEFEKAWVGRLAATNPHPAIVPTDSGIAKIPLSGEPAPGTTPAGAGYDGRRHQGLDPHIWLSPELVKQQAAIITAALCRTDPPHTAFFRHNDSLFVREISRLQDTVRHLLSGRKGGEPFMVFHPAWGYFAKEFGLREVAIEVEGKEPSPREMVEITDLARREGVKTIYVQPQFSRRSAEIIAREIGARVAVADDLAQSWEENLVHFAASLEQ
jgi:zinc transport system substrate-binding protein